MQCCVESGKSKAGTCVRVYGLLQFTVNWRQKRCTVYGVFHVASLLGCITACFCWLSYSQSPKTLVYFHPLGKLGVILNFRSVLPGS